MRLWSESQMLCRLTPDPHPQCHTDTHRDSWTGSEIQWCSRFFPDQEFFKSFFQRTSKIKMFFRMTKLNDFIKKKDDRMKQLWHHELISDPPCNEVKVKWEADLTKSTDADPGSTIQTAHTGAQNARGRCFREHWPRTCTHRGRGGWRKWSCHSTALPAEPAPLSARGGWAWQGSGAPALQWPPGWYEGWHWNLHELCWGTCWENIKNSRIRQRKEDLELSTHTHRKENLGTELDGIHKSYNREASLGEELVRKIPACCCTRVRRASGALNTTT